MHLYMTCTVIAIPLQNLVVTHPLPRSTPIWCKYNSLYDVTITITWIIFLPNVNVIAEGYNEYCALFVLVVFATLWL